MPEDFLEKAFLFDNWDSAIAQRRNIIFFFSITNKKPADILPAEWLTVLKTFKACDHPETIIAGGALRDTLNGKPVRDVDIFVSGEYITAESLAQIFDKANLVVHEQRVGDSYYVTHKKVPNPVKGKYRLAKEAQRMFTKSMKFKSWTVIAGAEKTRYNIISCKNFPGYHTILKTFDLGFCQIACNGDAFMMTSAFLEDRRVKRIVLRNNTNTTPERIKKLVRKYDDWQLCEKSAALYRQKNRGTRDPGPS